MAQSKKVSLNGKVYDVSGMSNVSASEYLHIVADNTKVVQEGIGLAIIRALEEIGLLAEGYAKRELSKPKSGHKTGNDPRPNVDTGALRNSVTHQVDPKGRWVAVGTNMEYAPHVELGTVRQKAWPFLRPAATEHGDEYRDILRSEMQNS